MEGRCKVSKIGWLRVISLTFRPRPEGLRLPLSLRFLKKEVQLSGLGIVFELLLPGIRTEFIEPCRQLPEFGFRQFANSRFNFHNRAHNQTLCEVRHFRNPD